MELLEAVIILLVLLGTLVVVIHTEVKKCIKCIEDREEVCTKEDQDNFWSF